MKKFTLLLPFLAITMAILSCQLLTPFPGGNEELSPIPPTIGPTQLPPATQLPPPPPAETAPAASPQPTQAPATELSPAEMETCPETTCVFDGLFLLKRPIGPGGRNTIVYAVRYGEYRKATQDALRGVYFLNSSGTPVLAAADGKVILAGDDEQVPLSPILGFYGNLVILRHDLPGLDQPLFTLYAHLSEISVKKGDQVKAGQEIGLVGMSGNATGSTLLFEVRLGKNRFQSARNPELWLEPLPDETGQLQGALAGRVIDSQGKYVQIPNILVERLAGPGLPAIDQIYLKTYSEKRLIGQSPWGESFAAGDLPAGEYQVSIWHDGAYQQVVKVEPGKLSFVTLQIK